MEFIGRKEELNRLNNLVNRDEQSVALIYGRRRIGKSELVKKLISENLKIKNIYYECKQVAERSNVESLSSIISDTFELPKLGFLSIEETLRFIFKLSTDEKIILVLDEYPYLKETIKGIDSILQSLIDEYKGKSKLKLIVLGSYVEVMKTIVEHSNPLYGRVDLTIDLKQMDYFESSLFYPSFSLEDKVKLYSVFGGIPYYNRLIDEKKSVKENIINLIASPFSRLENEVSMYLGSEISKITNANEVFDALSKGFSKYSDILSQSHVSSGPTLVDVLEKLIKMEVVEKIAPINEENNRKKVSYVISDNLSLFYYRYIFKYSSQRQIMNPDIFYEKYIEKDFESNYVPHQFETICKQYLIRKNKLGDIEPVVEKIGKYYYDDPINHKNAEFDIVTLDEKGYVFYEVKYRNEPLTDAIINKEITQVEETGLNCYRYVFFSKSGYNGTIGKDVEFINIIDMF